MEMHDMRSIWTGTVGWGMVTIPVKLGTAVSEDKLPLHRVRRSDGSRVRQLNIAEADGQRVAWEDIRMGYETGTGQVVVVEKEDFERAYGEKNRTAAILAFVPADAAPRTAHETSYYVQPGPGGERAYALLALAMEEAGKAAVVSIAVRQREALGLLYSGGNGYLVLERLHWAAEVKQPDFAAPAPQLQAAEISMAANLVSQMSGTFNWPAFTDKTEEKLTAVVQAKLETGQVLGVPAAPAPGAATLPADIMTALAASVAQITAERQPKPVRKPRTRKTAPVKETVA
jgi:DNA end-binding protein Ku